MPLHQNEQNTQNTVDVVDVQIPMFRVVLYNDDYTTFDFVISILIEVFHKSEQDAIRITNHVHHRGKGVAGTYPREIAEMKVRDVHQRAEAAGYPLRAGVET